MIKNCNCGCAQIVINPAPVEVLSIETPSGKDADYENFPVGSILLPAKARPHVATFYHYARAIDDIADSNTLSPEEKINRLDSFAAAIKGEKYDDEAYLTGIRMRESLLETNVPVQHCLDLIDAFQQDATQNRYDDWDDLMHYCIRSAAPVGRYLIDLTGGTTDGYKASDALCNALQVINHLQDCKYDFETLNRVYLPMTWMQKAGCDVSDLVGSHETPELRIVINQCLEATRSLMIDAYALPSGVVSRRLAMESGAIIRIADALIDKLAVQDPTSTRVKLTKPGYVSCIVRGACAGMFA